MRNRISRYASSSTCTSHTMHSGFWAMAGSCSQRSATSTSPECFLVSSRYFNHLTPRSVPRGYARVFESFATSLLPGQPKNLLFSDIFVLAKISQGVKVRVLELDADLSDVVCSIERLYE